MPYGQHARPMGGPMAGQPSFGAMGQQPRAPAPGMAPGYGMQPQQGQQPFTPGNRSVPFGQPIAEPAWSQGQQRVQGGLPPAQGGGLAQAYQQPEGAPQSNGGAPQLAPGGGMLMMSDITSLGAQGTMPGAGGGMVDVYDGTGNITGQRYQPSNLVNEDRWRQDNQHLFSRGVPIQRGGQWMRGGGQAAVFNTPEMQALRRQSMYAGAGMPLGGTNMQSAPGLMASPGSSGAGTRDLGALQAAYANYLQQGGFAA